LGYFGAKKGIYYVKVDFLVCC